MKVGIAVDRETEISAAIFQLIKADCHEVAVMPVDLSFSITAATVKPHLVLNFAQPVHSPAYVPSILDFLSISYSGSDTNTSAFLQALTTFRGWATSLRIQVPRGEVITSIGDLKAVHNQLYPLLPLMVKPIGLNRGVGISERCVLRSMSDVILIAEELFDEGFQSLIIEEFIEGREISFALLGNGVDVKAYPIEIDYEEAGGCEVFGIELRQAYYRGDMPDLLTSKLSIDRTFLKRLHALAISVYKLSGCNDSAQIDFRIRDNSLPLLLDVNPVPELSLPGQPKSRFMAALNDSGIEFHDYIRFLLNSSTQRTGVAGENEQLKLLDEGDHAGN